MTRRTLRGGGYRPVLAVEHLARSPAVVGEAYSTDVWALANLPGEDDCEGHWIKATVHPDGRSYFVGNGRSG